MCSDALPSSFTTLLLSPFDSFAYASPTTSFLTEHFNLTGEYELMRTGNDGFMSRCVPLRAERGEWHHLSAEAGDAAIQRCTCQARGAGVLGPRRLGLLRGNARAHEAAQHGCWSEGKGKEGGDKEEECEGNGKEDMLRLPTDRPSAGLDWIVEEIPEDRLELRLGSDRQGQGCDKEDVERKERESDLETSKDLEHISQIPGVGSLVFSELESKSTSIALVPLVATALTESRAMRFQELYEEIVPELSSPRLDRNPTDDDVLRLADVLRSVAKNAVQGLKKDISELKTVVADAELLRRALGNAKRQGEDTVREFETTMHRLGQAEREIQRLKTENGGLVDELQGKNKRSRRGNVKSKDCSTWT
ncbi:hypothetical protein DENSPDRAFT_853946 [Dentipellis sp. KUC8613]|nr:hypothetical protein DENSPDRAFT_853946 [Dentipellis sp. KUC8613]